MINIDLNEPEINQNTGKIIIKHFETNSTNPRTVRFCNNNNAQATLVLRHEKEHARKANITKNLWYYSPKTRGMIAAQSEIIAPAAEIIEALDYRYEMKLPIPSNRKFIKKADRLIITEAKKQNLQWPLDFNNQQIADIIIQCATEQFLNEINRGLYKTSIYNAIQTQKPGIYVTNNLCNEYNKFLFNPRLNLWAPLWQFESRAGSVNLWNAASQEQKNKMLTTIDSLVCAIAGKNQLILSNTKTY